MTAPLASLAGRTALVTGASRGIGRSIALRLAAHGATVAINYRRDANAAAEVVKQIVTGGGRAHRYGAPIDEPDAVTAMLAAVADDLGPIDLLVSNAGLASRGTAIVDTDRAEYQRLLDVHLLGPLDLIRALLPGMRIRDRGDILVISSTTVGQHPPSGAAYTLAKSAMEAAAHTLAREEREHGIRVNIVAPGLVATDMGERLVAATSGTTIADLDASYPFGRVARPDDVAGVVAFLASHDASYLTGQRLEVDGGGPDRTRLL